MVTDSLSIEISKNYKVIIKYIVLAIIAYVFKYLVDLYLSKKRRERDNSHKEENLETKDLFKDNVVVDNEQYSNYYHEVYIKNVELSKKKHIPFNLPKLPLTDMIKQSKEFYEEVNKRRTCRYFSEDDVPREVVENCVRAAGTAPSGAHTEPWSFIVVYDKETREAIREIVEDEELINYERRQGKSWLKDLEPVGTTNIKKYISDAPCVILVFKSPFHLDENGEKHNNWYYEASVSISVGILLCALNHVGLVTVTSTPMNCGPALRQLVGRPSHEKLAFLLPIGFPSTEATVPDFHRKALQDIMTVV